MHLSQKEPQPKPTYQKGTTVDNSDSEATVRLNKLMTSEVKEERIIKEQAAEDLPNKVPANIEEVSVKPATAPSYMTIGKPVESGSFTPAGESEYRQGIAINVADPPKLKHSEIPETIQVQPETKVLKIIG